MIPLVILGLGRIGAGNIDLAGGVPLSHLAAALSVGGFDIQGLVDPDEKKRRVVMERYPNVNPEIVVDSLDALPSPPGAIMVIATPPENRLEFVTDLLDTNPGLLIMEKPLAADFEKGKKIVALCAAANTELRVNFNRRFDRRHVEMQAMAPSKPKTMIMRYGKGLYNYASHLIDLLVDWYGPGRAVKAIVNETDSKKINGQDRNISFCCHLEAGFDAYCIGIDGLSYDQFEIDIFAEDSRLEIADGGAVIRQYAPQASKHYSGYTQLEQVGLADIAPVGGLAELYRVIQIHFDNPQKLPGCNGNQALMNLAILDAAERSFSNGEIQMIPSFER